MFFKKLIIVTFRDIICSKYSFTLQTKYKISNNRTIIYFNVLRIILSNLIIFIISDISPDQYRFLLMINKVSITRHFLLKCMNQAMNVVAYYSVWSAVFIIKYILRVRGLNTVACAKFTAIILCLFCKKITLLHGRWYLN